MSDRDFSWYSSTTGTPSMAAYPSAGGETFRVGEPTTIHNTSGQLVEAGTDPPDVAGIAAHRSTDRDGTSFGSGFLVTVYKGGPDQTFRTTKFATDGAGTAAVPVIANIGKIAGFIVVAGSWFLDLGAGNGICEVTGILDSNGRNLSDPNLLSGTGSIVLFRFI